MKITYYTNKGSLRKTNQDSLLINTQVIQENMEKVSYINIKRKKYTFFVADGIGGKKNGDIASKLALELIAKNRFHIDKGNIEYLLNEIKDRFDFENIIKNLELGTTLSGIYINQNIGTVISIGDSRVYGIKKNQLVQLSVDHSYVSSLIKEKKLPKGAERYHPARNILTSSLSFNLSSPLREFHSSNFFIDEWDYIFICSDGIWELLEDNKILELFQQNNSLKKIGEEIINLTLSISRDNISFIIIKE